MHEKLTISNALSAIIQTVKLCLDIAVYYPISVLCYYHFLIFLFFSVYIGLVNKLFIFLFRKLYKYEIQLPTFAYKWLLNKPYENEVTLREQNLPLKCSQPLEISLYR